MLILLLLESENKTEEKIPKSASERAAAILVRKSAV